MAEADDKNDKKPGHTLSDHLLGQDFVHEHDGDADHDHDHFDFDVDETAGREPALDPGPRHAGDASASTSARPARR